MEGPSPTGPGTKARSEFRVERKSGTLDPFWVGRTLRGPFTIAHTLRNINDGVQQGTFTHCRTYPVPSSPGLTCTDSSVPRTSPKKETGMGMDGVFRHPKDVEGGPGVGDPRSDPDLVPSVTQGPDPRVYKPKSRSGKPLCTGFRRQTGRVRSQGVDFVRTTRLRPFRGPSWVPGKREGTGRTGGRTRGDHRG